MANVVLGMPTMGSVQAKTFEALMKIKKGEHKLFTLITEYSLVYMARDNIVKKMLENPEADYLWFVDSDIIPPTETLLALIEDDVDVVSAVYPYRTDGDDGIIGASKDLVPYLPNDLIAYDDQGNPKAKMLNAGRVGMGCCLIKREVLEKVMQAYGTCFTPFQNMGEDYSFSDRAREQGFELWIDGGVWCKHIGTKVYEV